MRIKYLKHVLKNGLKSKEMKQKKSFRDYLIPSVLYYLFNEFLLTIFVKHASSFSLSHNWTYS